MFQKGGKDDFLGMLKIPYGFIHVEGLKQLTVIDIANGKQFLTELVSKEYLTADDAQDIENAMRKAGLVEDTQAVYQKVREFQLPENFNRPIIKFSICEKRGEGPIPHGHLIDINGQQIGGMNLVDTMASGFNACYGIAFDNPRLRLDVISALKDIVNSDIPFNQDDHDQRYRALPEEVRNEWEQKREEFVEELGGFFDDILALLDRRY